MSRPAGVSLPRGQRPLPAAKPKAKRLRTKRERNAAKFGAEAASGGSRRARLQPPPWGRLALGSPLRPPRPVVITQHRLSHRGLFQHEVKSLDVRRLLPPGPGGDGPAPEPRQSEEGAGGGVPAAALKELAGSLAALLGGFGVFSGRQLLSERRRSLLAALRRHRRGALDPRLLLLAHRPPAQPPAGQRSSQASRRPPARAVGLGGWEVGDPPAGTPSPLRAVGTLPPPPRTPSPIFGAPRERENPFPWSSAEEDETPGGLTQTWGGARGVLAEPPPFWRSPQPPQEEEKEGQEEGWTPIAPPAFSPGPPPWGSPQPRDTRAPPRPPRPRRPLKIWRTEAPWDPPDPSRSPWDSPALPQTPPSLLWDPPDPARAPLTPPRLCRAAPIWSLEPLRAPPDPPRPLWDPPDPSEAPWDPRPWSPELPRAARQQPRAPRTPPLWNPEPPRAPPDAPGPLWDPPGPPWEPPAAPRPLWDSPEPPRAPLDPPRPPRALELWSPEHPWDPRPWSPEPPAVRQKAEPSRCCCCRRRLCRDTARRDPRLCRHAARRRSSPCRDALGLAPPRAPRPQPPRRRRAGWGGVGSPREPPGWGCPCWAGGF